MTIFIKDIDEPFDDELAVRKTSKSLLFSAFILK